MGVLSTVGNRTATTARGQVTALRERGVLEYLKTRPRAVLGSMGTTLLAVDAMRMDVDSVHQRWETRTGVYDPTFYAELGATSGTNSIRSVLDARVDEDAEILELGCSSGRNLAHLHEHGYENLSGIDINQDALDVMAEHYPDLAADATVYQDAMENVLTQFEDGAFDVVFSVETLQHVHPDNEWVFDEIARITDRLLITKENEPDGDQLLRMRNVDGFPLYFRQWKPIFTDRGFVHVTSTTDNVDILRVFQRGDT